MKYIKVLLCLLFMVTISVGAMGQTLLNEDFEGTAQYSLPTGWSTTPYNSWTVDGGGVGGSHCIIGQSLFPGNPSKLISPVVILNGAYKLRFKYLTENFARINVYVRQNGTDNQIAIGVTSTSTSYEEAEYSLSSYSGSVQIVFEVFCATGTSFVQMMLDNIVIAAAASCAPIVDATASSITINSADLSWSYDSDGSQPSSVAVTVKDAGQNTVWSNATVTGNSCTATGLAANTKYTVSLQGDCNAASAGLTDIVTFDFTTLCSAKTLPYRNNFDGIGSSQLGCATISNATLASNMIMGTSGKSLQLDASGATDAYIIFPAVSEAANNIELRFMVACDPTSSASFGVGLIEGPAFGEISNISESLITNQTVLGSEGWKEIRVNTANTAVTSTPVALCIFAQNAANNKIYIDNVEIINIPTCVRPESLTISNITDEGATLDWTHTASDYVVYITNSVTQAVTKQTATTHPYTITGLAPQTTYDIQVQAICTGNDSSETSEAISFQTLCDAWNNPLTYIESFENTNLPQCWVTGFWNNPSGDYSLPPFRTSSDGSYSGTRSLQFGSYDAEPWRSGTRGYIASQALNIDTAGKYQVSMWMKRVSLTSPSLMYGEGIAVWATHAPGDTTGGIELGFINRCMQNPPVETQAGWYKYTFEIPMSGKVFIMFEGRSKHGFPSAIDNVTIELAPSCKAPERPSLGTADATGCTLSWNAVTGTQWTVDYVLSEGGVQVRHETVRTQTPSYKIGNVAGGKRYSVSAQIYTVCGSDSSEALPFTGTFSTPCDATSVFPYTEDFESGLWEPMCWSTGSIDGMGAWMLSPSTTHNRSSYSAMANCPNYDKAALTTGALNLTNANGYTVSFWMYRDDTDYPGLPDQSGIRVYATPTANSLAGATELGFVHLNYSSSPAESYIGYYQYEFDIPATLNGVKHVMFVFEGHMGDGTNIDDIEIREKAACAGISATVDSVKDVTARVNVTTTSNWDIMYGHKGFSAASGHLVQVLPGETSYILTGLEPMTEYDLYVRKGCGTPGQYSDWSDTVHFTTTSSVATLPWSCNFEDEAENRLWTIVDGTYVYPCNKWKVAETSTGNHSMCITDSTRGYSYGYHPSYETKTYAYRSMEFESAKYSITYRWKCTGGEQSADFGRVMLVPATEELTGGEGRGMYTDVVWPDGYIGLDPDEFGRIHLSAGTEADGWNTYSQYIDMTGRGGIYNFALYWKNDHADGQDKPLAIDDIIVRKVTCDTALTSITAIDSTSATISIMNGTVQNFYYAISTTMSRTGDVFLGEENTRNKTVTGLTPNTLYYYSVKTICGANDTSDWTQIHSFRTSCLAYELPYEEGFETADALNCWKTLSGQSSVSSEAVHAGSGAAKVIGGSLVTPELNATSLANYVVTGWALSNNGQVNVTVGVALDPMDLPEPIDIVTIPRRNEWTQFSVSLASLTAGDHSGFEGARYVTFSVDGDNTVYFDDIKIAEESQCKSPSSVIVSYVMADSVNIAWTEMNEGVNRWVVKAEATDSSSVIIDTVTVNPTKVRGLDPETEYYISVASICGEGSISDFVGSMVKTPCELTGTPYTENFEAMAQDQIPHCWDNSLTVAALASNQRGHEEFKWGVYQYGGNKMIRMNNNWLEQGDVVINSPIIALAAGEAYSLSYDISHRAGCGDLKVSISTDGGETFNQIGISQHEVSQGYDEYQPGEFKSEVIDLAQYAGENIMIQFKAVSNLGLGSIFIDNVEITSGLVCLTPKNVSVVNVGSHSGMLNWTPGGTETQWVVKAKAAGKQEIVRVVTSPAVTFSGLDPATTYKVTVASLCGISDTSAYSPAVDMKTTCDLMAIPYVCDFEPEEEYEASTTYDATVLTNHCWTAINTDNALHTITDDANYVAKGTQALLLESATVDTMYLLLPAMDGNTDSLKMTFRYRSEDEIAAGVIEVGYMADINNWTTWHTTKVLPLSMSYVNADADFVGAPAAARIGFKYLPGMYPNKKSAIDDIRVTKTRSCADIQDVTISGISEGVATINITDTVHTQWQYAYGEVGMADTANATLTQNTVLPLSGLTPSTEYEVYTRAYCSATEQSYWTRSVFKTASVPAMIPYVCGFDDAQENANWKFESEGGNVFVAGTDANALKSGSNGALYVSSNGAYTYNVNSQSSAVAYRRLTIPADGNYMIEYDWKCTGGEQISNSVYDYGRAYLLSDTISVELPESGNNDPRMIALDGGVPMVMSPNEWNHESLSVALDSGAYNLVFTWINDNGWGTPNYPLAINNVSIISEEDYCYAPSGLYYRNLGETAATVAWSAETGATYEYSCDGITGTTADDSVRMTGLLQNTTYTFMLRKSCSDGMSDWTTITFTTLNTEATLPYVCDFENAADAAGWTLVNGNEANKFTIGKIERAAGDSTTALFISDDGTRWYYGAGSATVYAYREFYLASGEYDYAYDWTANGELNADFGRAFIVSASENLVAGSNILVYGDLPSNYMSIDNGSKLIKNNNWSHVDGSVNIVYPGMYRMVFMWINDAGYINQKPLAVDNVSLRGMTCSKPVIAMDSLGADEVRIAVTNRNQSDSLVCKVSTVPGIANATRIDTVTGNQIVIDQLAQATQYYVYVSSYCGAGDESQADTLTFRTICGGIGTYPYIEDFESIAAGSESALEDNCWLIGRNNTTGNIAVTDNYTETYAGQKSLKMYASSSNSSDWQVAAIPVMNDPLAMFKIEFQYDFETRFSNSFHFGYLTDANDVSTFVTIDILTPTTTGYTAYSKQLSILPAVAKRLAFKTIGYNDAYVDNITLTQIVKGNEYHDTICHGMPYISHGFNVPAQNLNDGDNTLYRTNVGIGGNPDTLITAYVYVTPIIATYSSATICSGEPYTWDGGTIANPVTARYSYTYANRPGKCDSTIYLDLTVLPSSIESNDTICEGDNYQFGDTVLTTAGDYTMITTNSLGCPVTVTLHLAVVDSVVTIYDSICGTNYYDFDGELINTAGTYRHQTVGAHGCPLTKVLVLTVTDVNPILNVSFCRGGSVTVDLEGADTTINVPGTYHVTRWSSMGCTINYTIIATETAPKSEDVYAHACEGKPFSDYGAGGIIITKDTLITKTVKTSENCDSIVNFYVKFEPTTYDTVIAKIGPDGTYTWNEQTYTKPGDYTETLQSQYGCDSVVVLRLMAADGTENVTMFKVDVVPNPVNIGNMMYVYGEFDDEVTVEVMNNFGQTLSTFKADANPIAVEGIMSAGIYYIRVTNSEGDVSIGKVIVK
ncbi:MAG: fibronectin type III domain-containing protein [Paludibacteraceae bacterium]|nr:fibronectin type III domain-containing protein [Paludibacteraceae bacterium]